MSHSSNRYNPGYKHQESHQGNEEQSGNGFPGPPRDTHHSNQAIAGFSSSNRNTNQSSHQAMVGYSANHYNSNHSNSSNMDVDTSNSGRKQYSSNTNNTMKQDPSGRMMDERARRSSSQRDRQPNPQQRSSSSSQRPSHYTPAPPQAPPPYRTAPPPHFTSYKDQHQPSFPPPAVTSDSSPSEQRRPAYLLHRDLVIGKGSYGQVCIASRGESEGHAARSGKRKKFACKCVMLRNDPKYIAKLQEEVNVLRELRGHDNVIRLYDVFCVDNELFIITELGRGGDLFHLLTTHPKHGVTESYAGKFVVPS